MPGRAAPKPKPDAAMGTERDALVGALLALRHITAMAMQAGVVPVAVEAKQAARKAEDALRVSSCGCPGCGGPVEAVSVGRPRRWCCSCHPPRTKSLQTRAHKES